MNRGGSDDSDLDEDVTEMTPEELKHHDPKRHARAQHNALERRRRDNIKDMYSFLRETVPDMQNERASRAMILRKAIEAIEEKQAQLRQAQSEVSAIEAENAELERRIREILAANGEGTDKRPSISDVLREERRRDIQLRRQLMQEEIEMLRGLMWHLAALAPELRPMVEELARQQNAAQEEEPNNNRDL